MVDSIKTRVIFGHFFVGVLAIGMPNALCDCGKQGVRDLDAFNSPPAQGEPCRLRNAVSSSHHQIWFSDSLVRDLTGDGLGDTVVVLATGTHPDSLEITLTIGAEGTLYHDSWASRDYHGPEGYSDPDRSVRQLLYHGHFGLLDPRYNSAERERSTPRLIAEQIGGTISLADEIYREMINRRMPFFAYDRGSVGLSVAWSPSRRRFLVLLRLG